MQQALAAMQGKNASKVPLPSKRSSVTRTTAKDDEDEETGKRKGRGGMSRVKSQVSCCYHNS